MTSEEARELADIRDEIMKVLEGKRLRHVLTVSIALAITVGSLLGYSENDFMNVVRSTWTKGEQRKWNKNMNQMFQ